MVNRNIQQKMLKNKRKGRYARFSGANTKYATRIDRGKQDTKGHHVIIPVGEISLSKAVMSSGRGPDKERMQEYYQRIHSYDQSLPQTLGLTEPMKALMRKYDEVIKDTPREMRISLVKHDLGMLDLYFNGQQFFFVDVDFKKRIIRRSRIYGTRKYAMMMLENDRVVWVETVKSSSKIPVVTCAKK